MIAMFSRSGVSQLRPQARDEWVLDDPGRSESSRHQEPRPEVLDHILRREVVPESGHRHAGVRITTRESTAMTLAWWDKDSAVWYR